MRLNLNDNIRVKLTEHGKDIYYHQYDRTNAFLGRELCKPSYPEVDEDGYTTFQLWCFIELYGVHMGMTLPNVIEPLDIVFDAPTIESERKKRKWIYGEKSGQDGWYCSECGGFIPWYYDFYGLDNIDFIEDFKTCPFCDSKMVSYTGADMRGEER